MGVGHFSSAKPRRLYRDAATWVLEVERLVPLDERVLRPTIQRLTGTEVVLFQLANSDEGRALVSDARRLMADASSESASYEAEEGRWIPAAFVAQMSPSKHRARRDEGAEHAALVGLAAPSLELTLMREEIRELRASQERLQRRVAHLEREPNGAPTHAIADVREKAPAVAETKPRVAPKAASPGHRAPAFPVHLPTADALVAQMSAMTGEKSKLTVSKKPLDLGAKDLWTCLLTDDAKNVVGAIVANLEAVISQGAQLMLLPEHEVAEQIKTRSPNEAVTSAMSEILNVCIAAFNAVPENLHVRTLPIEPLPAEHAEWLTTPGPRLDLADTSGAALAFVLKGEGT